MSVSQTIRDSSRPRWNILRVQSASQPADAWHGNEPRQHGLLGQLSANGQLATAPPVSANVISATLDGRPLTIDATAASPVNICISWPVANYIDGNSVPSPTSSGATAATGHSSPTR